MRVTEPTCYAVCAARACQKGEVMSASYTKSGSAMLRETSAGQKQQDVASAKPGNADGNGRSRDTGSPSAAVAASDALHPASGSWSG